MQNRFRSNEMINVAIGVVLEIMTDQSFNF